jgi:hypothetical protein
LVHLPRRGAGGDPDASYADLGSQRPPMGRAGQIADVVDGFPSGFPAQLPESSLTRPAWAGKAWLPGADLGAAARSRTGATGIKREHPGGNIMITKVFIRYSTENPS